MTPQQLLILMIGEYATLHACLVLTDRFEARPGLAQEIPMVSKYDAAIDNLILNREAERQLNAAKAAKAEQDRIEAEQAAAQRQEVIQTRWAGYKGEQDLCVKAVMQRSDEILAKIIASEEPLQQDELGKRQWKVASSDGSVFRTVTFTLRSDGNLITSIDGRDVLREDITDRSVDDYATGLTHFVQTILAPSPPTDEFSIVLRPRYQ